MAGKVFDGRTGYTETLNPFVERMCKEFGATDVQIALMLKISISTLQDWKRRHERFRKALLRGKDAHDSTKVKTSLLGRALGMPAIETTYNYVDIKDPVTEEVIGQKKVPVKVVEKQLAPDVAAARYWLNNRGRGKWSDRQEFAVSGDLTITTKKFSKGKE